MSIARKEKFMEIIPSASEMALAQNSSRSLAKSIPRKKSQVSIRIVDGTQDIDVVVPVSAFKLFVNLLSEMAQGNAVTVMPLHAELTTQQAADLLNVSRPFFIKLLDEGKISFKKVGRHRRISARDVLDFKQKQEQLSDEAMNVLMSEAQKLNLGYE